MAWICISCQVVMSHTLHVPVGRVRVFLGKMTIPSLCPFFNLTGVFLLLGCVNSLYILCISPLSQRGLAPVPSHLFCWGVPLLCRSLSVGCSPSWLFLFLSPLLLLSNPKNHHQDPGQGAYCLFSSRSFLVSGLIFRSSIRRDFSLRV